MKMSTLIKGIRGDVLLRFTCWGVAARLMTM